MMRFASALAVLSLAVTGCAGGGAGPAGPGDQQGDGSQLQGRTFLSTEFSSRSLVIGTRLSIGFPERGKITAQAGCNHLFGTVAFQGDKLVVSDMGGTDMGCDQPRHEQDEWITKYLTSMPVWALSGDDLTLTSTENGEIKLKDRKVVEPDKPLAGTRWEVESLVDGQATGSIPGGATADLTFTADGKVTGNTGCNRLNGTAKQSDGKITFEAIATTKILCPGDLGLLERAVLAVLDGQVTAKIDGDRLELQHPSGKGLHLRAVA